MNAETAGEDWRSLDLARMPWVFENGLGLFVMPVLAAVPVGQSPVAQFPIFFEAIQTAEYLVLDF